MPKATGIENALCESWNGWDGDTEWLYFYNVKLWPEIKAKCIEKGMDPTSHVDLDIDLTKLTGRIITLNENHDEVAEYTFSLRVTPEFN